MPLEAESWVYRVQITHWIDGDTCALEVEVWPGQVVRQIVRLDGVNCPEIHTKNLEEKAMGHAAWDFVRGLLPDGSRAIMRLTKKEKFGRWLARLQLPDGEDLAARIIREGHGKDYHGEKR